MPESNLILITGASGRIGRRVAELLAGAGYRLRLMTRNADRAPHLPASEIVRGDYSDHASLAAVFAGVNKALIVSAAGEPGKRALQHRNAFEAAARARVDYVVYLSLQGAGLESKYPYSRDHFLSERFLAETRVPHTVLRDAFYIDMFLKEDTFEPAGIMRGPAAQGQGAFVSREDVAQTTAAVLRTQPEGIYDVTGPEALPLTDVAARFSSLSGHQLRYEDEPADTMRARLQSQKLQPWQIDLATGWFEAIAAGELRRVSDTVRRFTGTSPLSMEDYFRMFPELLRPLRQ